VAGQALDGGLLLVVTVHAKTHRVIHDTLGHGRFPHVAMTGGAVHFSANVGCVVEQDVGLFRPSVNPLPGGFFAPVVVRREKLDFRTVSGHSQVAEHAGFHAGNARNGSARSAVVTKVTRQSDLVQMQLVRVSDRLFRFRPDAEEMPDGLTKGAVRRREDGRFRRFDFSWRGLLTAQDSITADDPHRQAGRYYRAGEYEFPPTTDFLVELRVHSYEG
jgi:hypothetical protein